MAKWQATGALTGVRAEIVGGLFVVEVADEPYLEESSRRQAGATLGPFQLQRTADLGAGVVVIERGPRSVVSWVMVRSVIERGWAESVLRSDVFRVRGLLPDAEWSRALHRIDFSVGEERMGTWQDLGVNHSGCVPLLELGPMQVAENTRFEIGWLPGLEGPLVAWDPLSLGEPHIRRSHPDPSRRRLRPSEVGVTFNRQSSQKEPRLQLLVMGSDGGAGKMTLTVTGPADAVMCHNGG